MAWTESCTLSISERSHEGSGIHSYAVEWRLWSPANRHSCRDIAFGPEGFIRDYQLEEAEADFRFLTLRLVDVGFRLYHSDEWEPWVLPNTRQKARYFDRIHDGVPPAVPTDHERSVGHVPPEYLYADRGLDPLPNDWSGPRRQTRPR